MGVAAILTGDLFRLRSTLDPQTQEALDHRRLLAMKPNRSVEEESELRTLNEELHGRGFDQTTRDPLYERFVKAWTEREDSSWRQTVKLTPKQQEDRARLAAEIVEELRR